MAIYYENLEIVAVRLALLVSVIIFGVPGNIVSIYLNVKSFKRNKLNGIVYLHLAVVDLCLCCLTSSLALVLEAVGYYSLNNDMGSWASVLKFLARDIGLRLYFCASFISLIALTFVAVLRAWRVFFPFGQARKRILMSVVVGLDLFVVLFTALLNMPQRILSKPTGLNLNQIVNDTDGVFDAQNDTENIANVTDDSVRNVEGTGELGVTVVVGFNFSVTVMVWSCGTSVVVITAAYLLICLKLRVEQRKMISDENPQKHAFLKRQLKHLVTHFVLFVIMVLTYTPSLFSDSIPNKSAALTRLMTTVGVVNSAVNPYIYCLLVPANRTSVRRLLCCKKKESNGTRTGKHDRGSGVTQGTGNTTVNFTAGGNDRNRGTDVTQGTDNTTASFTDGLRTEVPM